MATLSRGQTFGSTETVTNTKLHNLVDLGSCSNIVDADISPAAGIQDTKLGDITTGNKVRGTALGNLASIPSGAGLIPAANIGPLNATLISFFSGASIPNLALAPIVLASWLDGAAFRNLGSSPSMAGKLPWWAIVGSLASGASPAYDGASGLVGAPPAQWKLVSSTSYSGVTTTGEIAVSSTKQYKVIVHLGNLSASDAFKMAFNGDTSNIYEWVYEGRNVSGSAVASQATNTNVIALSVTMNNAANSWLDAELLIPIQSAGPTYAKVSGQIGCSDSGSVFSTVSLAGRCQLGGAMTSFSIRTAGGATFDGRVSVYEMTQA